MEMTIYSGGGGLGMILEGTEKESDFVKEDSVVLHSKKLKSGDFTSLDGYFNEEIRYCGNLIDDDGKCMVFHAGDDETLFEAKKYYYLMYWINENRIATSFMQRAVRDFHWMNERWK